MALDPGIIYGRGMAFPPRIGSDGRLAWSEGEQNIRESIRVILMTSPGERIRQPEFGAGLQAVLFEPNTPARHRSLEDRIQRAITRWEPRIALQRVIVEADPTDPEAALVTLEYELIATRTRQRLAFNVAAGG